MRVRKKEMACRIKNGLAYLSGKNTDREEIIDSIIHYFARLHGIGVAVEEREGQNDYEFMFFPHESGFELGERESTSRACRVSVGNEYIKSTAEDVRNMLKFVEGRLNLPHWEDYLEEKPKDGLDVAMCRCVTQEELEKLPGTLNTNKLDVASMCPKEMFYVASRNCGKTNFMTEAMKAYCEADVKATQELYRHLQIARNSVYGLPRYSMPDIAEVIFHDPATIIFWKDGTKTVVKAQDGEMYDPEKGLAMAICKKVMGNTRDYYIQFKKHLKKYHKVAQCEPEKKTATDDKDCWIDRVTN